MDFARLHQLNFPNSCCVFFPSDLSYSKLHSENRHNTAITHILSYHRLPQSSFFVFTTQQPKSQFRSNSVSHNKFNIVHQTHVQTRAALLHAETLLLPHHHQIPRRHRVHHRFARSTQGFALYQQHRGRRKFSHPQKYPIDKTEHRIAAVLSCAKGYELKHAPSSIPDYKYIPTLDKDECDISIHFD